MTLLWNRGLTCFHQSMSDFMYTYLLFGADCAERHVCHVVGISCLRTYVQWNVTKNCTRQASYMGTWKSIGNCDQCFKLGTTQTILPAGDNKTAESSKFCLKQDTRSVTVRFKAAVQQNECSYSLWVLMTKHLTFKFTYPYIFPPPPPQKKEFQNYYSYSLYVGHIGPSSRMQQVEKLSIEFQRICYRKLYWHLVPEIQLTFGIGNYTDI